jgi:predicted nucleic acid-binding protein
MQTLRNQIAITDFLFPIPVLLDFFTFSFALPRLFIALAYRAGYDLRRKGITVPTIDILILSIAKVHNCSLLHHDKHFKLVAKHLGVITLDFIDQ